MNETLCMVIHPVGPGDLDPKAEGHTYGRQIGEQDEGDDNRQDGEERAYLSPEQVLPDEREELHDSGSVDNVPLLR